MVVRSTWASGGSMPVTLGSTRGLVTANSVRAAVAGALVLDMGGNAMDATAAAAFAAGVVEPAMSGIGGRGYLIVLPAGSKDAVVIDGHERAPAGARADMFPVAPGEGRIVSGWGVETEVVGNVNRDGHLAVAVPGVLPALGHAHDRFGVLAWHSVLGPAIELATQGFDVDETLATALAANEQRLARFPATAEVFLPRGRAPVAGERFLQPDLAHSLRALAANGPDELRDGQLARAVALECERGGGLVTLDDLARIAPRVWSAPATTSFHGHRVLGVPDATGAVTLIEILNMLEAGGISGDVLDADSAHFIAEVFRAAFEDRRRHVDDGEQGDVPFGRLTDKRFASERVESIDRSQRHDALAPAGGLASDRHTTHFCAVDEQGMVVSMTQSLVDAFGSAVVVPGTGILLNSAMHNFNPVPGELGSIAPWKRAAHFGCPLLVLAPDGRPRLALGGGGGTKIVTGLAQVLVRVIERGESLANAIAAPRIHCDGAAVELDERVFAHVEAELRARGHDVELASSSFGAPAFARLNGIEMTHGGATAGVDPFSDAGAAAPSCSLRPHGRN